MGEGYFKTGKNGSLFKRGDKKRTQEDMKSRDKSMNAHNRVVLARRRTEGEISRSNMYCWGGGGEKSRINVGKLKRGDIVFNLVNNPMSG